ncbi:MAG: peptide chain release factor N(5)-glutamine methyltransferase [Desulfomonile sp.]|nr:peptide chain release factor N(5)-glutamine methyltransferase [Desulfomonile sp.]
MTVQPSTPNRWTVGSILQWTAAFFGKKGIANPRLDAELLLAHALGVDRLHLYINYERPLLPEERDRYRELVRRRAAREPIALIVASKEFWSIPLRAVPGVLIPRPETELLVEVVLKEVKDNPSPRILEIGTGSGAVSIALAKERPDALIVATDTDPVALSAAMENSRTTGVTDRLNIVGSDLFAALRPGPQFHVICSNPPYVPTDVIPTLQPEIILFEPRRALDGGPDGLDVIRRIAADAVQYLTDRGVLALEIGDDQEAAVREALANAGFSRNIQAFPNLADKPRVVKGARG